MSFVKETNGSSGFKLGDTTVELMDESFDFIVDDEDDGLDQEVDDVSNVLLTRFEDAPILHDGVKIWRDTSRILKFKLNPNGINGVGFILQDPHSTKKIKTYPQETKIYTSSIPTFDNSHSYITYVSNLFKIYEALGDERYYSVPTIGLIKRDGQKRQAEVLSEAINQTTDELKAYIEAKLEQKDDESKIFELEETLNIVNCLNAVFFTPEYDIPEALAAWVNRADPQPDLELTSLVMKSEIPYKHPHFWKFIIQLTLRGLNEKAAGALKQSGYDDLRSQNPDAYNFFVDSINLLQSYPEHSSHIIFKQWKQVATNAASNASIRNSNDPELAKNIKILLDILSGNKATILEHATSWYESLLGLIYYHIPSPELLQEYASLSLKHHTPDRTSIWELASIDIFEGNFLQTLRAISTFDIATAAYVSALCEAKGLLNGYSDEGNSKDGSSLINQDLFSAAKVSEFLLHSHALDSLAIEELVPVGVGLLTYSRNPTARSVVAEFLPKFNFQTTEDILWALRVTKALKLPQVEKVIKKIAAQRSLSNGLLLESLTLFAESGEIDYVKHHTWLIFENSLIRNGPIEDDVINSVVDDNIILDNIDPETLKLSPLLRQTLAPYANLYQFWILKQQGALKEALSRLISLLKFPHLPTRLFGVLLAQLLPFISLTTPPRVLQQRQLLAVVRIIDKFEDNIFKKDDVKSIKLKQDADKLYKYSITHLEESSHSHWAKISKELGIAPPNNLEALITYIRRGLSVEIGRSILDDVYN